MNAVFKLALYVIGTSIAIVIVANTLAYFMYRSIKENDGY